ncbi:Tum protein [Chimaeribacter arupi]|uniref:Tum protein n=1 Tax=Chimaeribacter arupi TaxID=2060066 RepID=UPI000C7E6E58|nr:Tum protein [Chimaeribacter arupi]PLR52070.1 Tum protein [Chimaeribacter arupi]
MDQNLKAHVALERVELIARLTAEGGCQERDREVALLMIADLARGMTLQDNHFQVIFSARPLEN